MCQIFVCESERPTKASLKSEARFNSDGGGIAWRKNNHIEYRKGLTTKQIHKLTQYLAFPYVIHFRFATEGEVSDELCHPFEITSESKLRASGEAEDVLFHNGHWDNWEDKLLDTIIDGGAHNVPKGSWSDSRAIAIMVAYKGKDILQYTPGKFVYFSPNELTLYGNFYTENHGIKKSSYGFSQYSQYDFDDSLYGGPYYGDYGDCETCKKRTCLLDETCYLDTNNYNKNNHNKKSNLPVPLFKKFGTECIGCDGLYCQECIMEGYRGTFIPSCHTSYRDNDTISIN